MNWLGIYLAITAITFNLLAIVWPRGRALHATVTLLFCLYAVMGYYLLAGVVR